MMIRRTGIALTVALILASPAAAGWSPPQQLGAGGSVAIATDGPGNRSIAWVAGDGVRVAFAHEGGPFRHARVIPGSEVRPGQDVSEISIAMDRTGRELVAWTFFDNSQPSTFEHSDTGCCSDRRAAIVNRGVPARAATLTAAGSPEDVVPGGLALGPHGRAAVVTDTSGANVATLSHGTRWRLAELPNGPARPVGVYFRHGRAVVTFVDGDRLRDAVLIGPDHFRTGRVLYAGALGVRVATSTRGRQALLVTKSGGTLIGALRAPGGPFRTRALAGSPSLLAASGPAIADSGRALAVMELTGRFAAATGSARAGFSAARLGPAISNTEPGAAAVRADGWGLFLYSTFARQGSQPLDAAFVSPSGRIGPGTQVSDVGGEAASAIDSRGAVVAWSTATSILVSRSPVPGRR